MTMLPKDRSGHSKIDGFTLPELIVTMVLVGIVAAVAIPRMVGRDAFDQRAFADGTAAALRYAQKSAIAQRRTVCVDFSAAGVLPATVSLRIVPAFGGTCDDGTAVALPLADGEGAVTAAAGLAFSPAPNYPAGFFFNPSGSASLAQTFWVQGLATRTIIVEGATGYVH